MLIGGALANALASQVVVIYFIGYLQTTLTLKERDTMQQ